MRLSEASVHAALLVALCLLTGVSPAATGPGPVGPAPAAAAKPGAAAARPPRPPAPHAWVIQIAQYEISGTSETFRDDFAEQIEKRLKGRPGTRSTIDFSGERFSQTLKRFEVNRAPGVYYCPPNEHVDVVSVREFRQGDDKMLIELTVVPIGLHHGHEREDETSSHCHIRAETGSEEACREDMIDNAVEMLAAIDKIDEANR